MGIVWWAASAELANSCAYANQVEQHSYPSLRDVKSDSESLQARLKASKARVLLPGLLSKCPMAAQYKKQQSWTTGLGWTKEESAETRDFKSWKFSASTSPAPHTANGVILVMEQLHNKALFADAALKASLAVADSLAKTLKEVLKALQMSTGLDLYHFP